MSISTNTDINTIYDVSGREVDNLVMLYGNSQNNRWMAMAFQINQVNRRSHIIDNLPQIADGETLDSGYFGEDGHSQSVASPGKPITRIEGEYEETIIEYGFAVEPDDILVWVENPANKIISGMQGDRLRGLGPGSDSAGIWSQWTRTEEDIPTTTLSPKLDQGIMRIDSNQKRNNIYMGFENQSGSSATPTVTALGMAYKITKITDRNTIKSMLFGENTKRRIVTWGGFNNSTPNLPANWENGIPIDSKEVTNALKSGRA